MNTPSIERHESYRGRTTPEVTWRVWNATRNSYVQFTTKRDAVAYEALTRSENSN
jgi:hypothetical protein